MPIVQLLFRNGFKVKHRKGLIRRPDQVGCGRPLPEWLLAERVEDSRGKSELRKGRARGQHSEKLPPVGSMGNQFSHSYSPRWRLSRQNSLTFAVNVYPPALLRRTPDPSGAERFALDGRPAQIHVDDTPGVGDVVERVRLEHHEIGALAGLECAQVVQLEQQQAQHASS